MPGSVNYKGHTQPFNDRVQLERDREAARQALKERMAQAQRDASPIVTPPTRRRREAAPSAIVPEAAGQIAPSTEATTKQEN